MNIYKSAGYFASVVMIISLDALSAPTGAQNLVGPGESDQNNTPTGAITTLDRSEALARVFGTPGLREGDNFPSVDIFDESGQPYSTEQLKGYYTVLVNGCLT